MLRIHRRATLRCSLLAAALLACTHAAADKVKVSAAIDAAQAGMVEIRALAPDIAMDIRYAGRDNFTGDVVPGYEAAACYLLQPVAEALARVQHDLRAGGYSLQIYDCYRPVPAVHSFVDWAGQPDDPQAKQRHYPNVAKDTLIDEGYIASTSGHSRGATVDLGLLDCRAGRCEPLDMGTPFDFFDPIAHTDTPGLTDTQRGNRKQLLDAMARRGFANYPKEWWHFTFRPEPDPTTAYGFPVR